NLRRHQHLRGERTAEPRPARGRPRDHRGLPHRAARSPGQAGRRRGDTGRAVRGAVDGGTTDRVDSGEAERRRRAGGTVRTEDRRGGTAGSTPSQSARILQTVPAALGPGGPTPHAVAATPSFRSAIQRSTNFVSKLPATKFSSAISSSRNGVVVCT